LEVRGKKVTVVGMGRTALALTRLLQREGARPFVTESRERGSVGEFAAALEALGADFECGGHSIEAFAGTELVIPSPGVPPGIPHIRRALYEGTPIMGEMEFAARHLNSRVLAVTGTNGKTTTTELVRAMVAACGKSVLLAGNNDRPLSAVVLEPDQPEYIVLEVSSYQLETAWLFHPWVAAVLNVTPDHLERHKTVAQYASIKAKIFNRQRPGEFAVLNADDEWTAEMTVPDGPEVWWFSLHERPPRGVWFDGAAVRLGDEVLLERGEIPLPGSHNVLNAMAALCMTLAAGFGREAALGALRAFGGVEHRIEHAGSVGGVAFVNDSKSTNIDSLRVALCSFDTPVVLIAGGRGKGSDYAVLADLVRERVKAMVTIGEDAPLLEAAFGGLVPAERAGNMADAVRKAVALAAPGGTVLLSPGCASFDMFDNFEHRGRVFKECVRELAGGEGS
jgi:UDP-N-acetylmuramoylalanine--D-glutamate ligase